MLSMIQQMGDVRFGRKTYRR